MSIFLSFPADMIRKKAQIPLKTKIIMVNELMQTQQTSQITLSRAPALEGESKPARGG
jgi:hypothetical protein